MNLTNHFLIAMPGMTDPFFKRAVVYICEHNDEGAMGIIINSPIEITVGEMLDSIDITPVHPKVMKASLNVPVLNGGPIAEDRGLILHQPKDSYQSTIDVSEQLSVTTSKDILNVLGTEAEPKDYVVALGYSGWGAGQLESELAENSWLTVAADPEVIFSTPADNRWQKSIEMLGIDAAQLSTLCGHA